MDKAHILWCPHPYHGWKHQTTTKSEVRRSYFDFLLSAAIRFECTKLWKNFCLPGAMKVENTGPSVETVPRRLSAHSLKQNFLGVSTLLLIQELQVNCIRSRSIYVTWPNTITCWRAVSRFFVAGLAVPNVGPSSQLWQSCRQRAWGGDSRGQGGKSCTYGPAREVLQEAHVVGQRDRTSRGWCHCGAPSPRQSDQWFRNKHRQIKIEK